MKRTWHQLYNYFEYDSILKNRLIKFVIPKSLQKLIRSNESYNSTRHWHYYSIPEKEIEYGPKIPLNPHTYTYIYIYK
jgi:hypothetical protein